jgi:hypothetical protein
MKPAMTWVLAGSFALLAMPTLAASLTAVQIVEKNVAARGGLEAWRNIKTMVWLGHIERANVPASSYLPFALEMKRPNKTRFEIKLQNQMSVRMFDGSRGWKLSTGRNGQLDAQPYTSEEVAFAREAQSIDGPLIDHHSKGITVALDGIDDVEGRKAYRLRVTAPSGASHHVWIDAETFLDVKSDRASRGPRGVAGTVSVYYHDYRAQQGVQMPFQIESGSELNKAQVRDKMVIERILLNPPLDDRIFSRPHTPGRGNRISSASVNSLTVDPVAGPRSSAFPAAVKVEPSPAGAGVAQ